MYKFGQEITPVLSGTISPVYPPLGFIKMRHYGILSSRNKAVDLNKAKEFFGLDRWQKQKVSWELIATEKLKVNPFQCKKCGQVSLEIMQVITAERAPPIKPLERS